MRLELTSPCADCPFRKDIVPYLSKKRAKEISEALLNDQSFTCHKRSHTTGWDRSKDEQHCAGAMIMLERADGRANQIMRISERIGMYDRNKLNMDAPVFRNFGAFISAQD